MNIIHELDTTYVNPYTFYILLVITIEADSSSCWQPPLPSTSNTMYTVVLFLFCFFVLFFYKITSCEIIQIGHNPVHIYLMSQQNRDRD